MARLILKCPYLKGGSNVSSAHRASLIRYIATRDGVEHVHKSRTHPATEKQQRLIDELTQDFSDSKILHEYSDYVQNPTIANASDFISRAIEENLHSIGGNDYYIKYIATRPRAEKLGGHGLFGANDEQIVLSRVQDEIAAHEGNIWTPIISLRREDAAALGYDNAEAWQNLLRLHAVDFAKQMKIQPENFRWYAAYHDEGHHPHCHMVCYSVDPHEGFLTQKGIEKLKSALTRDIFAQELISIYSEQTNQRDLLRDESVEVLRSLCRNIQSGAECTDRLEQLMLRLSQKLANTSGKKVYGYLKADVKAIVDEIVDELAKNDAVAKCYEEWHCTKNMILQMYKSDVPEASPLSQVREFKKIKNAVIAEAVRLGGFSFDEVEIEIEPPVEEKYEQEESIPEMYADWTNEYKQARKYLFGAVGFVQNFSKAYELMLLEGERGNAFAMHDLGRIYADGLGVDAEVDTSFQWYEKALIAFIELEETAEPKAATYLQYRIGKMYMAGVGTEQNYEQAAEWLAQAANAGNKYAQYSLAGLYYRGLGVEQSFEKAFMLYEKSAEAGNAYASYELAKMYRDGVGTAKNQSQANIYFRDAYAGFVVMEAQSSDDRLQYRLGQMCRDGVGTDVNPELAEDYFTRSARLNNENAQYALSKIYLKQDDPAKSEQAIAWLEKLAEKDSEYAQHTLGQQYLKGEVVPQDIDRAIELLTKSAEQNNQFAQYTLGKLYLDGEAVSQDIEQAIELLTKSAEQENQFAQYTLGKLYLDSEAVPQDIDRAIELLTKSAEQNNQFSQYTLGKLYLDGEAVPQDIDRAIELLTKSAEQNNQFAQYQLGKIYIMGKLVPRDKEMALHWFELAAAQGNEYAQFFIDHIDEIGLHNPDLFMSVTSLFGQMESIFNEQTNKLEAKALQLDQKRRRILREKKLAQGHAHDEHEQNY